MWLVAQGSGPTGWMNRLVSHAKDAPMILVHNTGGCADVVARAVLARRTGNDADEPITMRLPWCAKCEPLAAKAPLAEMPKCAR